VHQIGLPYHWGVGNDALVSGDSANDLFGITLDPNVHIQETKVGSCDIQPGRRPRGPGLLDYVAAHRDRAHVTTATGNQQRTPPEGPDGRHASEAGSHGHSTEAQVGEGHAAHGQYSNAAPDEGQS
jgi:formate dehydrogenase major subunit